MELNPVPGIAGVDSAHLDAPALESDVHDCSVKVQEKFIRGSDLAKPWCDRMGKRA